MRMVGSGDPGALSGTPLGAGRRRRTPTTTADSAGLRYAALGDCPLYLGARQLRSWLATRHAARPVPTLQQAPRHLPPGPWRSQWRTRAKSLMLGTR